MNTAIGVPRNCVVFAFLSLAMHACEDKADRLSRPACWLEVCANEMTPSSAQRDGGDETTRNQVH